MEQMVAEVFKQARLIDYFYVCLQSVAEQSQRMHGADGADGGRGVQAGKPRRPDTPGSNAAAARRESTPPCSPRAWGAPRNRPASVASACACQPTLAVPRGAAPAPARRPWAWTCPHPSRGSRMRKPWASMRLTSLTCGLGWRWRRSQTPCAAAASGAGAAAAGAGLGNGGRPRCSRPRRSCCCACGAVPACPDATGAPSLSSMPPRAPPVLACPIRPLPPPHPHPHAAGCLLARWRMEAL